MKPFAILFLLAGTAGAQTYDPSQGESPLVLLAVPRDGVAYYETKIGRPDPAGWTREEGWKRDIDHLYNETKRVNPDYRNVPFPAEVTRRYEELKKNVSKLSDEEPFVGLSRMLAPLHQGHVALWSPSFNRHLPIRLYAFPEGLYIIAARRKKLALSPCNAPGFPSDALCGTYEVFENRATRTGRKIPLRVLVVPANEPNKKRDAITYFSGGPGASAVDAAGFFLEMFRKRGPQTRDLLFVDLRGTGKSAPLDCAGHARPESVQGFLDNFYPEQAVRACREELSRTADLSQYTSEIAADDVDEVREALGYEKLNLISGSYGTRTAQVYMRRHPTRVRTSALLVTLPNDARTPLDFARSAQNALDGLIAECAGDAACRKAFPRLGEEVAELLRRVEKEPARAELIDPRTGEPMELRLNRDGVAQALRYLLYDTSDAARLPLYVHLAHQGDFRPLAEHARAWSDSSWLNGYFLAITCAEDVAFIREEEIPAAVAGTFLGDFRIRRQQAACRQWSPARLGPEFLEPTVSDAPTLLTSGERDPVTPPRYAEKVLRHLRNGLHVMIPDGAHDNNGMKNRECEDDLVVRFIEAGTAKGLDTSCVATMERPAFLLSLGDPEVNLAKADLERLAGTYRDSASGFEARVEPFDGNRLRVHYSDEGVGIYLPTSATRFRSPHGTGSTLVFRMEAGRPAGLILEQHGQPLGGEMLRVP